MTLERIGLPGVGVSHVLTTRAGQLLGIVSHLDGQHDLVVYDRTDPERAAGTVELRPAEARLVADVLNATRTGGSIVAVVRGEEVNASPGPAFVFRAAGDAVGHDDGLAKLRDLLAETC